MLFIGGSVEQTFDLRECRRSSEWC